MMDRNDSNKQALDAIKYQLICLERDGQYQSPLYQMLLATWIDLNRRING